MTIETAASSEESFRRAFIARVHPKSEKNKDISRFLLGFSIDKDRDYFIGEIDDFCFEICRPVRINGIYQRSFSGTYYEANGHVVVDGSFRLSNSHFFFNLFPGILTAAFFFVISRFVISRWFGESTLAVIAALVIGIGFGGFLPYVKDRLLTISCEKDVVRFLSTLK